MYGLYKRVPRSGDTIKGVFLPAGTAVGHNAAAIMRSEATFGQDTEIFRPERFLECDETKRLAMQHTVDLVFGTGRWMCAGKALAFVELNKVIFEVSHGRTICRHTPCQFDGLISRG